MIKHSGILLGVSDNTNQIKEGKHIEIINYRNDHPHADSIIIYSDIKFCWFYDYFLDLYERCKWSTNTDEPLLFVKYDMRYLNILDVEKKTLALKDPIQMDLGKWGYFLPFIFLSLNLNSQDIKERTMLSLFSGKMIDLLKVISFSVGTWKLWQYTSTEKSENPGG